MSIPCVRKKAKFGQGAAVSSETKKVEIRQRKTGKGWEVVQLFSWFHELREAEEAARARFPGSLVRVVGRDGELVKEYRAE